MLRKSREFNIIGNIYFLDKIFTQKRYKEIFILMAYFLSLPKSPLLVFLCLLIELKKSLSRLVNEN